MRTAVVILNWNGKKHLEEFLPSVLEFTNESEAKIIVADNGSSDDSLAWLNAHFPEIQLILLDKNYGFTGGYNRALEVLQNQGFEYFLLLNSDVAVSNNWLTRLTEFMDTHPKVGVCSPKILSYKDPEYFEYAGACGGFIDNLGFPYCQGRILSKLEKDKGQYDENKKVFWVSGAALMIRSELWKILKGLDESFFAHMEEIDLCWRAQQLDWEIWVVPSSKIFHLGGGTLANNSPFKLYLNYRNSLLMLNKNLPDSNRKHKLISRMLLDGFLACCYLITGRFSSFRAVLRAHKDYKKMKVSAEKRITKNKVGLGRKSIFFLYLLSKTK